MGDMSELYELYDYWCAWEDHGPPPYTACKRCGEGRLHWDLTWDGKWSLFDENCRAHVCRIDLMFDDLTKETQKSG